MSKTISSFLKEHEYIDSNLKLADFLITGQGRKDALLMLINGAFKLSEQSEQKKDKEACNSLISKFKKDLKALDDKPLDDFEKDSALEYIEKTLNIAKIKVNTIGTRYIISLKENTDYASLDKLIDVTNKVFDAYRKTWNFSSKDRKRFEAIEKKIDSFLNESDKIIKTKNLFLKLLNCISEFFFGFSLIRYEWENKLKLSHFYTDEQWKCYWRNPGTANVEYINRVSEVHYHK